MKSKNPVLRTTVFSESEEVEPPSLIQPTFLTGEKVRFINESEPESNFPVSDQTLNFIQENFPDTSLKDWNNWRWQIKNSFTNFTELKRILNLSENELGFSEKENLLPLRITPYYASLLDKTNFNQPLRKSVVPVFDELITANGEKSDPLSEEGHSPVKHIVHRYPDRVLFLATGFCATYCRYCTRSHMVSKKDKCHVDKEEWDIAIDYIRSHPEIRDVLISGGDPFTLPEIRLEYLLSSLSRIEHIEIIRIGTKVPVVLPQRVTQAFVKMLKKYHPLFVSIHFTHPDELTIETKTACKRLADAGIPLGSQTVLLKDVNDDLIVFKKMMHELLKARVRPYYLYQCDPIPGSYHFKTPVEKGVELIKGLRGHTSGYAVPHYVIDAPDGGGKIPLLPDYYEGKENGNIILRNYEGKKYYYPDAL